MLAAHRLEEAVARFIKRSRICEIECRVARGRRLIKGYERNAGVVALFVSGIYAVAVAPDEKHVGHVEAFAVEPDMAGLLGDLEIN